MLINCQTIFAGEVPFFLPTLSVYPTKESVLMCFTLFDHIFSIYLGISCYILLWNISIYLDNTFRTFTIFYPILSYQRNVIHNRYFKHLLSVVFAALSSACLGGLEGPGCVGGSAKTTRIWSLNLNRSMSMYHVSFIFRYMFLDLRHHETSDHPRL